MKPFSKRIGLGVMVTLFGVTLPALAQTDVHVNAGGTAYMSKVGTTTVASWDADRGFTGGAPLSTTTPIESAIAGATISADDQKLYQSQRAGPSLVFSAPVTNGTYNVTLYFAEIEGKAIGARKFGVKVEDAPVLTDFDIVKEAGGANRAISRSFSTTITDGKLDVELMGTAGDAAIAGISLSLPSKTGIFGAGGGSNALVSPSLEQVRPFDAAGAGTGAGPSSADQVDLVSGVERHAPPADIIGRNPIGPDAPFSRAYKSSSAIAGIGSPGMATGWNSSWDFSLRASDAAAWSALTLQYPDGAGQVFNPNLNGADADGTFRRPVGERLQLSGNKGATVGAWSDLTLLFDDLTKWTFSPSAADPSVYVLSKITNYAGKSISVERDAAGKVLSVSNDAGTTLLAMTYDGDGRLNVVSNNTGQAVRYTFGDVANTKELLSVSQLGSSADVTTAPAQWSYAYTAQAGAPLLTGVSFASATGTGLTSHPIDYDPDTGRVTKMTDAVGNGRFYEYIPGATRVTVKDPAGATALQWVEKFDEAGRTTGFTDANGQSGAIAYGDPNNPLLGTSFKNRLGQTTTAAYDLLGNLTQMLSQRGIATKAVYDTTVNPFGLVKEIASVSADATPRTITVGKVEYNAQGLPIAGYAIKPGATDGTLIKVSELTYTPLGNVATLGKINATGTMSTTRFNYTTDGTVAQAEVLGQPLTATDPLNRVTHFRYDTGGKQTQVITPRGNVSNYSYNDAGRVVGISFPKLLTTSPADPKQSFSYASAQGPCIGFKQVDEAGTTIVDAGAQYDAEGNLLGHVANAGVSKGNKFSLDAATRLKGALDAAGNLTKLDLDGVGNLSKTTLPDGEVIAGQFDADGNVSSSSDGPTSTFKRATDDSRVLSVDFFYNGQQGRTALTYDGLNRTTKVEDENGSRTYIYDDAGNILSVETFYIGMLNTAKVSYAYNPDSSLASMTTPMGTYSYAYDAAGQQTSVTAPWNTGTSYKYVYNEDGLLKSQETSKIRTTFGYNPWGLPSSIINSYRTNSTTWGNGASFSALKYNGMGQLLGYSQNYTDPQIGQVKTPSGTVALKYDDANRIAGDKRTFSGTTVFGTYDYTFNRDERGLVVTTRTGTNVTVNAVGQHTDPGNEYTPDGRKTKDPTAGNVVYGARGKPISVEGKIQHGWRADGLRAWRDNPQNTSRGFFLYDELSGQVLAELDSNGKWLSAYSYGPYGLVSRAKADAVSAYTSYAFDPLGNLNMRIPQTASLPSTVSVYDAFGGLVGDYTTSSGQKTPATDPIGAKGQAGIWTDEVLKGVGVGLPMVNSLYYDPQSGQYFDRPNRFKSTYEPIPYEGQNVLRAFEVMSYVPVVGAPFNVVLGVGAIQEGHPFLGSLQVIGGFADAAVIAEAANAAKGSYALWKATGSAAERGAGVTGTQALAEEAGAASKGSITSPVVEFSGSPQAFTSDLSHVTGKTAMARNRAISAVINEDLKSLRLTHQPQYSPFMRSGIAARDLGTQIGKNRFFSRSSLRDVIVHEELHHRWWAKGIFDHHPEGSEMEAKFYATLARYRRMRGWD